MFDLLTLAQGNNSGSGSAIGSLIFLLFVLAILVIVFAGMWKVFVKAGQPGWAAIVPIYNAYIMTKIVGRQWWWMLLMLIPYIGVVFSIIILVDLSKSFGKSTLFAVGLVLLSPIFICILGFGPAQYIGPSAAK